MKIVFRYRQIVSDSGADLNDHLIRSGIADEISLIVAPVIATGDDKRLLSSVDACTLDLIGSKEVISGRVHLRYALRREPIRT